MGISILHIAFSDSFELQSSAQTLMAEQRDFRRCRARARAFFSEWDSKDKASGVLGGFVGSWGCWGLWGFGA